VDVCRIAAACADGFLILDEAYRSFVAPSPFGPTPAANTLVLRSMTKDFALAGLRLGYALGAAHLLQAMRSIQPPWSVSGVAQAAGLASLGDLHYLYRTLELTRQSALSLRSALSSAGANVLPGATHYLLIDVGQAASWRKQLLTTGCLVRDCSSFGLISYMRVSTRSHDENQHLIKSWPKDVYKLNGG
jgi:histidinol-phosphate/aromatic aminotransferase/cobyric acid decarboxylase-like protein